MRVYEVLWKKYESCWERLCDMRGVQRELYESYWERRWSNYYWNLERLRLWRDQTNWTRHDQARLMGNDQASLTTFKIEYLRLGFPFSKPSLRDSSLKVAYVASVWSTRGNRVLDTQFPCKCQVAIRPHQNTETEPQRLDLQAQNRAFEARDVIKWYSFKTSLLTKWFGFYGHLAIFAQN